MSTSAQRPPPPPPKPTPEEWHSHKDEIEDLYVFQEQKLSYVADTLRQRHGFIATQRMYKSRIKEWAFDQKTIREADWRFMFQEYHRRKNQSTPKETIFAIRENQLGRVAKPKTLKHIRNYIRRKRVSEEAFLSVPSDRNNFPHIRPLTPPLSPEPSSESASPASQMHDNSHDEPSPSSLSELAEPSYGRHDQSGWLRPSLTHPAPGSYDLREDPSHARYQILTEPNAEFRAVQTTRPPHDRRENSYTSSAPNDPREISTNSLVRGLQGLARQTLAPDRYNPSGELPPYRQIAGPPSPAPSGSSQVDDGLSGDDLASVFRDIDARVDCDETMAREGLYDPDEVLAFRWASRYFFACISKSQMNDVLAKASMKDATRVFELMLKSETRTPCRTIDQRYSPSHRSRYILSGLSLMFTVLTAHGRDDMLEEFLHDSLCTIDSFFRMEGHPLSIPYSYLLADTRSENVDDAIWDERLKEAHIKIRSIWGSESPNAVVSQYYWAWHILKRKRFEEAFKELTSCLSKAENLFGRRHIITLNCLVTIARASSEQGMYDTAIEWLESAIERSQFALSSEEHPFRFKLIERLGVMYRHVKRLDVAEKKFKIVVDGWKRSLGFSHELTAHAINQVADIMVQRGNPAEAIRYREELYREHAIQHARYWHWDDQHERQRYRHWYTQQKSHPGQPPLPVSATRLIELH